MVLSIIPIGTLFFFNDNKTLGQESEAIRRHSIEVERSNGHSNIQAGNVYVKSMKSRNSFSIWDQNHVLLIPGSMAQNIFIYLYFPSFLTAP